MEIVAGIAAVLSVIVAIIAWLRPRPPVLAAQQAAAITSTVDVLSQIRAKKSVRVGYLHYPPFCLDSPTEPHQADGLYV